MPLFENDTNVSKNGLVMSVNDNNVVKRAIQAWVNDNGTPRAFFGQLYLTGAAASAVTFSSATITVSIANSDRYDAADVYIRYRPVGTTAWVTRTLANQDGATATLIIGGLAATTNYEVQASLDSDFGIHVSTALTTLAAPPLGAPRNLRVTRTSRTTTTTTPSTTSYSEWSEWDDIGGAISLWHATQSAARQEIQNGLPANTDTIQRRLVKVRVTVVNRNPTLYEARGRVERRTRTLETTPGRTIRRTRYTYTAQWDAPSAGTPTGYQVEVGGTVHSQTGTTRVITSNSSSSSNSIQVRVRAVNTNTDPDIFSTWAGPVSYS